MRIGCRSHSHNQFIVGNVEPDLFSRRINLRNLDKFMRELDVFSFGADEVSIDTANDSANGFDERSKFERANSSRGQHGGEQEVVGW